MPDSLRSSPIMATAVLCLLLMLPAAPLPGQLPPAAPAPDSVAATPPTSAADSAAVTPLIPAADTLVQSRFDRAELASRSRFWLPSSPLDSTMELEFTSEHLRRSRPFYLDDLFRRLPGYLAGDSLGNGYPRRLSLAGAGFDAPQVRLDGMPLNDPLTGGFDWRMVSPRVLAGVALGQDHAFGSPTGGVGQVDLLSARADLPEARSELGIAGGAYAINQVGGGLQRTLFGSGALNVQLNKTQQSTEDFDNEVEEIQFFTRLEQALGRRQLLSLDGLFFSSQRTPEGGFRRLDLAQSRMQLALAGLAGEGLGYRLAWWRAAGSQPFQLPGGVVEKFGAVANGFGGSLGWTVGPGLRLGLQLQGERTRPEAFPADTVAGGPADSTLEGLAGTSLELLASVGMTLPGRFDLEAAAGLRDPAGEPDPAPIWSLRAKRPLGERAKLSLGWSGEVTAPSLAGRIIARRTGEGPVMAGKVGALEALVELARGAGTGLSLGVTHYRFRDRTLAPYELFPFSDTPLRQLDYRATAVSYRLSCPELFGRFRLELRGLEFPGAPARVPWLPARRHTALLGLEGPLFQGDLDWSIQAEAYYEGALRFPVSDDPAVALARQPGRFNLGGAAQVRIITLTIYGRADFLASSYYNTLDPLRLPGPRAVFGINWEFFE